ncbi:MAG: hypothetical protein ACRC1J_08235 [Sandaracinobacteroides sp.]
MRTPILLVLSLTLLACGGTRGSFPSLQPRPGEMDRVIAAPGAGITPALSAEQQDSLRADLAREARLLAEVEADLARTGAELDRAIAAARGSGPGSEGWSNAQMALSRFDLVRSPLGEITARLSPLQRTVDSLPGSDPDRRALEALLARTAAAAETAQRRVDAANRAL